MPTVSAYPNAVKLASDFASAANVVGNTTAYATHNGIKAVGQAIFAEYGFDLSAIPANALIDRIRFNVIAKANAAGRRTARWIDVQHANGGGFSTTSTPGVPLQSTDTTATIVLDRVADAALWAQMQMTTAAVRDPATGWGVGFESTIASTTLTSWQKFWLDVDYTLPAAGVPNLLFMNEPF